MFTTTIPYDTGRPGGLYPCYLKDHDGDRLWLEHLIWNPARQTWHRPRRTDLEFEESRWTPAGPRMVPDPGSDLIFDIYIDESWDNPEIVIDFLTADVRIGLNPDEATLMSRACFNWLADTPTATPAAIWQTTALAIQLREFVSQAENRIEDVLQAQEARRFIEAVTA